MATPQNMDSWDWDIAALFSNPAGKSPGQFGQPFNSHMSVQPAASAIVLRKYTAEDWNIQKSEITRLYEDNTLENVRSFMKERHGLEAT